MPPLGITLPYRTFTKLPDPAIWAKYNIKLLSDITSDLSIYLFDLLISQCNIPPSHLFGYLQYGEMQLVQRDLERVLRFECSEKPITILYAHLIRVSSPELSKLRQHWAREVLELDSGG